MSDLAHPRPVNEGDGTVEVRIVAGGGSRDGDYFGVFRVAKEPL